MKAIVIGAVFALADLALAIAGIVCLAVHVFNDSSNANALVVVGCIGVGALMGSILTGMAIAIILGGSSRR